MLDASSEKMRRLIDELAEFSGSTVKAVIKEKVIVLEWKPVLSIVIDPVIGIFGMGVAVVTIACHKFISIIGSTRG